MINTKSHLAYIIKVREIEIESIINSIDKHYYEKVELKADKDGTPKLDKNGIQKKRILHPSINRLKQIQKRILKEILSKLEIPDYAYGAIKKRDNVKNARKHQGKKYIFTTDLKDFFPSIKNRQVFEMFRSFNFSPTVSRLLTQLTTYKGKLPQGTPTSPALANLVFIKTGKKLQEFAAENKLTFTSFIDDLTFSAPIDFKTKANFIIDTLQKDGFRISHSKTNYKTKNPTVTGIVVKNNNLAITPSYKIKILDISGKTEEQIRGLNLYADRVKKA
ncbi:MAG: reverse transcriptase family protein [Chitinophagaceae bacterium]